MTDTVTVDDTAVDVRVDVDNGSFAYLDWIHAGVAYRLVAFRTTADEIDSVLAEATRMVADVRYA